MFSVLVEFGRLNSNKKYRCNMTLSLFKSGKENLISACSFLAPLTPYTAIFNHGVEDALLFVFLLFYVYMAILHL